MAEEIALCGIPASQLALVHATNRKPLIDADGVHVLSAMAAAGGDRQVLDAIRASSSHAPYGLNARVNVHFTLQEPVGDHAYGKFSGRRYTVYAPLVAALESNGAPETFIASDVAFFAPDRGVHLPDAVLAEADIDGKLADDVFGVFQGSEILHAVSLNDANRGQAIALLTAANEEAPHLGLEQAIQYAKTASGSQAAVDISKTLALAKIQCPTLNAALGHEYERDLQGYDGWADTEALESFVAQAENLKGAMVARHSGQPGDLLHNAIIYGNPALCDQVVEEARRRGRTAIADFAARIPGSRLFQTFRDLHIMAELASHSTKMTTILWSDGAEIKSFARALFGGESSWPHPVLGVVPREEVVEAIGRAHPLQLAKVYEALLARGADMPSANQADRALLDRVTSEGRLFLLPPAKGEIHLHMNGTSYGPYDRAQVAVFVAEGRGNPEDILFWRPGMEKWAGLNSAQEIPAPPAREPAPSQGQSSILSRLGVTRVKIETHGNPEVTPVAKTGSAVTTCRAGMVAALALALGCTLGTPEAFAAGLKEQPMSDAQIAKESAKQTIGIASRQSMEDSVQTLAGHAINFAVMGPHMAIAEAAGEAVVAAGVGAHLKDVEKGALYAGAAIGLVAGLATGGVLPVALGIKGAYDAYKYGEKLDEIKEQKRIAERAVRNEEIRLVERERALNEDRALRTAWPEAARENDQRRTLAAAIGEYDQLGGLITPALQDRFRQESQRSANGLSTEPWFEQYQQHVQSRELEAEREIKSPDAPGFYG